MPKPLFSVLLKYKIFAFYEFVKYYNIIILVYTNIINKYWRTFKATTTATFNNPAQLKLLKKTRLNNEGYSSI